MLANQDCVFSDGLLSRLSFDDFLLVVVMMTKEDPSFFPSLLSAFKNSKKNGPFQFLISCGVGVF